MTMGAVLAFVLRSKISFRQRLVMSESIGLDMTSGVVRLTQHILICLLYTSSAKTIL